MILNIPFPQIVKTITVRKAIAASGQFAEAFANADGARPSPIHMIIGPVTTGGKKRITLFTPKALTSKASTR